MRDIGYDTITDAVVGAYSDTSNERLREILGIVIPRLHELVRDIKLTPEEWRITMDFLLQAAKASGDQRNDFILLSDLLGVSATVDLVDGRDDEGATSATLLGPFYVPGQPDQDSGADLIKDNPGERMVVQGQVRSASGAPLPHAVLEIWQNAPNGLYTLQDPDQPDDNLRCTLRADADGRYSFATVKPESYKVREDGAGGRLVKAAGWHSWRPAHVHFIISADGHKRHVSQIFNAADPYVDKDAVFGVRADLVKSFDNAPTEEDLANFPDIQRPFNVVNMDWVLAPVE
jgi:protocatechuate 3,4-dioxygenase beta subunit